MTKQKKLKQATDVDNNNSEEKFLVTPLSSTESQIGQAYENLVRRCNALSERVYVLEQENRKLLWENQKLIQLVKIF